MAAPSTYHPSRIAPRVTDAHKLAVWNVLAPPARLDAGQISAATGIDASIVWEVIAMGIGAKRLRIADHGVGDRGIERVE